MRKFLLLFIFCGTLAGASSALPPSRENKGKITQEGLGSKDKLLLFSPAKPCWVDKWKYFCCPVKKIVRRKSSGEKYTDYCYNSRDELIGILRRNTAGSVKRSDFVSIPGCSLCGNRAIKQKSWRHNTRPGVVIPPAKKRKR